MKSLIKCNKRLEVTENHEITFEFYNFIEMKWKYLKRCRKVFRDVILIYCKKMCFFGGGGSLKAKPYLITESIMDK